MTLNDLIITCEELRPSQFSKEMITGWVNEIESEVIDLILNRAEGNNITFTPYSYENDANKTLLVPDDHSGVYTTYIFSKEDFAVAEYDRYNADVLMADAEFQAYASYYRRTHKPKR